jgi:hypothetical protein
LPLWNREELICIIICYKQQQQQQQRQQQQQKELSQPKFLVGLPHFD